MTASLADLVMCMGVMIMVAVIMMRVIMVMMGMMIIDCVRGMGMAMGMAAAEGFGP